MVKATIEDYYLLFGVKQLSSMQTNIIVKWDQEGQHCWPEAPDEYAILRAPHKHIFHFEVYLPVDKSRQVEFLHFRRLLIERMLFNRITTTVDIVDFRTDSCEQIAKDMMLDITDRFHTRPARVVVMEDAFVGVDICDY